MTITAFALNKTVQLKLLKGTSKGINLQLDIDEARSLLAQLPTAIENAETFNPQPEQPGQ